MLIALCSDLHLEFSDINITNEQKADVLILSGDIMTAQNLHEFKADDPIIPISFTQRGKAERFRNFLGRVSKEFSHVIYIAGNHEFYHGKYPDAYDWLKEECDVFGNVYFLEMQTKEIDNVVFIGATLWTDMNKGDQITLNIVKSMLNDFNVIRNSERNYAKLSPFDTVLRHKKTLEYIKHVITNDPSKNYVVVGHHAPSKLSTKPRYEKDVEMNGGYSSDLNEFILAHPQIKLWTHGHTHDLFDYMIGNTRIVCNPRGYHGYETVADNFKIKYLEIQ